MKQPEQPSYLPLALLQDEQIPQATRTLSLAFHTDGMFMYVFPDEAARARHLPQVMGDGIAYGHKYGEVHVNAGKVEGVCVSAIRGVNTGSHPRPSITRKVNQYVTHLRYGRESYRRYKLAVQAIGELHLRNISGPHWYLLLLGVNPVKQGSGLGGLLLKQLILQADSQRLPIYLDTFKKQNLTFYAHYGFEVKQEVSVDGGKAMAWALVHPPKK